MKNQFLTYAMRTLAATTLSVAVVEAGLLPDKSTVTGAPGIVASTPKPASQVVAQYNPCPNRRCG